MQAYAADMVCQHVDARKSPRDKASWQIENLLLQLWYSHYHDQTPSTRLSFLYTYRIIQVLELSFVQDLLAEASCKLS